MNQPEDGPMTKLLVEANVDDLGSLIQSDIENLTFIAADKNPTAIGRYRATQPSPIGDNWNDITQEEFDAYLISPLFNGTIYGNTTVTYLDTPAAPSSLARDPVADFKARGIKCDPSQFPILKDDKQWDNWNHTHNAQARAAPRS
jgi:hypothetical protein